MGLEMGAWLWPEALALLKPLAHFIQMAWTGISEDPRNLLLLEWVFFT